MIVAVALMVTVVGAWTVSAARVVHENMTQAISGPAPSDVRADFARYTGAVVAVHTELDALLDADDFDGAAALLDARQAALSKQAGELFGSLSSTVRGRYLSQHTIDTGELAMETAGRLAVLGTFLSDCDTGDTPCQRAAVAAYHPAALQALADYRKATTRL